MGTTLTTVDRDGRGAKDHRPSWKYTVNNHDSFQLEMLESIRNTLEAIQQSQMLQCDVRSAIMEIRDNSRKMRIAIERLDRRMAKRLATPQNT